MKLADHLGTHVSTLLATEPFSTRPVRRSIACVLPTAEIWYEFVGHGIEIICDEDESIRTIFLHPDPTPCCPTSRSL